MSEYLDDYAGDYVTGDYIRECADDAVREALEEQLDECVREAVGDELRAQIAGFVDEAARAVEARLLAASNG